MRDSARSRLLRKVIEMATARVSGLRRWSSVRSPLGDVLTEVARAALGGRYEGTGTVAAVAEPALELLSAGMEQTEDDEASAGPVTLSGRIQPATPAEGGPIMAFLQRITEEAHPGDHDHL